MNDILQSALNIYYYGSYVYNTYQEGISDMDFIVILPNTYSPNADIIEYNNCHYSLYTLSEWQAKLQRHDVDAIETYFLDNRFKIKETVEFHINIDRTKIRENFSRTASNSWVKCKKKLEVEDSFNPRVAKKSLWHSLRIINFGVQIMIHGKIIDYTAMNSLYNEIVNNDINDYSYYKEKYQKYYNNLKTLFRQTELYN
jgi:hypothetical protein